MDNKAPRNLQKFRYFIGIDVSKNELDMAVTKEKQLLFHQEIKNSPDEINAFIKQLKTLPGFRMPLAVFCMEQTGMYSNHLMYLLEKKKAHLVIENPLRIKKSLGLVRGKNDKDDAIRIARFVERHIEELNFHVPRRPEIRLLQHLSTLRSRLLSISGALKNPLGEQQFFLSGRYYRENKKSCEGSIAAVKADIEAIDLKIDGIISEDPRLKRLSDIIMSVPNVGRLTAIQIIICTNEFTGITNPKKFACYAGVAPFRQESGNFTGKAKVSKVANRRMKTLLHICAMNSLRSKGDLFKYFERKTKIAGKPPMLVLNAMRYKLILRIFACLKQDRLYMTDYPPLHTHPKDLTDHQATGIPEASVCIIAVSPIP